MPTADGATEDTARVANQQRFSRDLEFLSALCNPFYLHQLSQQGFFEDPSFLRYLAYLDYFRAPAYVQYLTYPQALYFLDLLKHAEFRLPTGRPGAMATPLRTIATSLPRAAAPPKKSETPRDESIRAPLIRLVDPATGKVTGPFKPQDIVSKLDRKEYTLVQVAPGAPTKGATSWTMDELPVCKLVSKREEYQKQRDAKRKSAASAAPTVMKDMQLTWNVSGNDLAHKVSRARKELARGHKVHAIILSKKGTKRVFPGSVEDEQRTQLVEKIQADLCTSEEDNTQVAKVTHGPDWKNQRSLCEMHVEPL